MKKFFFLLIFSSSAVFACPQLAGSYSCTGEGVSYKMDIIQNEENAVTSYSVNNGEEIRNYIADGLTRSHQVMVGNDAVPGNLTATCIDSRLGVQFLGKYQDLDIDYAEGISLTAEGKVTVEKIIKTNGTLFSTENFICALNN